MSIVTRTAMAAVVGVLGAGCAPMGTGTGDAYKAAPPIAGQDGDGRFMQLADFRGQVVLLDFWFTHCPHCREFEPHEKALLKSYAGRPFVVLGVNADPDREMLQKTQQEAHLPWRSWWDRPKGPIAWDWNVQAYPTVYLIDHRGRIRHRSEGVPPSELAALREKIEQLVQEAEQHGREGN